MSNILSIPVTLILLTIINSILITSAQIFWKLAVNKTELLLDFSSIIKLLFNPFILLGFFLYLLATGITWFLLKKYDISLVIPMGSIAFIISLLGGYLVFHEHISFTRIVGVIIIILGIFLLLRS